VRESETGRNSPRRVRLQFLRQYLYYGTSKKQVCERVSLGECLLVLKCACGTSSICVSICTLVLVTGKARKIRRPAGAAGMTGPTGATPAFQVSVFVLLYW
jgi:hypothetical protein